MTNEIAIKDANDGFLVTNTLADAMKVADIIAKSSFCPKQFVDKPGDILVCMQMGKEVGLKPMQALQNIAVINGRPSLWGDAMLAVCRQASNFEFIAETFDEASMTAICEIKRKGEPAVQRQFSQADAKAAGLWGKQGPWTQYPKRMLSMRARGFALRDGFADTLRGIISAEEAQDYPTKEYTAAGKSISKGAIFDTIAAKNAQTVEHEECISEFQAENLVNKIALAQADMIALCNHYKIDTIELLPKSMLNKVNAQLDKKIAAQRTVKDSLTVEPVVGAMHQPVEAVAVNPEVQAFFED